MTHDSIYSQEKISSPIRRVWNDFSADPLSLVGLCCCIIIFTLAIIGDYISPYAADYNTGYILLPPSWHINGDVNYFLGTDKLGRDILSRLLIGAKYTLGLSVLIAICVGLLGFIIGALAGMLKGARASILAHSLDVVLSIPSLLLAMLFAVILGPGLLNVFLSVTLALTPQFMRMVYNCVYAEAQKQYVVASKLDGASSIQLFWHVILPNIWEELIVNGTTMFSFVILDVIALGFLSLGILPPTPEWGSMIYQSWHGIESSMWSIFMPGMAIFITVLGINLVGEGLRSAIIKRHYGVT